MSPRLSNVVTVPGCLAPKHGVRRRFTPGTPQDEIDASIASSDAILDEDRVICEAVQRNMAAGVYSAGVISPRHEAGVADLQSSVLRALGRLDMPSS